MAELMSLIEGKKDDDSIWVENLLSADSVYRSDKTKDKYDMAPHGFVGSIISVPVKVAKESYFRRADSRGKIRALDAEELYERNAELIFLDDEGAEPNRMMKSMEEGASDVGARYTKKGLSDDGTESKSIPAQTVWSERSTKAPSTVRRSDIKAPAIALEDVPDGPIPAIVTEPVKEGEWSSDTGLD